MALLNQTESGRDYLEWGSSGEPWEKDQELKCWGNGSCPGQELGPGSGGRSGRPFPWNRITERNHGKQDRTGQDRTEQNRTE